MALTKITSSVVEDGGIDHSNLPDTGVVSGSYGTGSAVPVLTVNEKGFVTAISTTAVAGVDDFTWNSVNETLTIDTSDGSSYSVDMSGLASETYVNTSIANLVDTAPATLDTLNELAAALGDDPNFATTMTNALAGKVDDSQVLTNVPSGAVFTDTVYTHPSYNGDDFSVDTGALAGATVVSDIDINVTTDTLGHVTDANGVVATRTLTLADLGYTGATNANNYVHPSYAGDDINLDTGPLSGATVISDLDFNVTTDTQGHVTDANATYSTRNLTYSDVGAAPASHSHSYLPLSGGTITGRLVLPDSGYSIGNEYHTWKRSYKINNTSPANLVYHDGTELDAGGAYRFHAHIAGTGTDQSATAVFWNQNGTWKVNVTYQSGTSSNHPEFIIGGSPEAPQIHIDHTSNYTVEVLGERLELSEGAGTDNLAGFGTDAFLGSVGGVLRYNNAGSANNYSQGNQVFHDGYHPNADKWTTARTLSLTGDVTGSVSWDGSGNASLTATVADDSHNHTWNNIDGGSVNSWGGLRHSTGSGYIEFGPGNTYHAHIYTDRPNFYFNRQLLVNGSTVWHSSNDGSGSGLDADTLDGQHASAFASNTPGNVSAFAMSSAPSGWLKCNGAAISRTTYSALFASIGTTFGGGNGSTTFNLPDLRGEFIRGWDDGRGADSGRGFGSYQGDAIRNITGMVKTANERNDHLNNGAFYTNGTASSGTGGGSLGRRVSFNVSRVVPTAADNRPRNRALLYCIKY